LTDIGLLVFPGLKESVFFNGFGLGLMFVEHQSTSENKDRMQPVAPQAQN
jgi:hypothetical protein